MTPRVLLAVTFAALVVAQVMTVPGMFASGADGDERAAAAGEAPAKEHGGRHQMVRFSTLEAKCRVLQCQPGELVEWVDE